MISTTRHPQRQQAARRTARHRCQRIGLCRRAETDARLVLVILRGAADGLAIAAPYGDGNYASLRGELALPHPGARTTAS